jgi:AhpD family alkylhydroperoxidase
MHPEIQNFNQYRSKMNERILSEKNKTIQKIYNADATAYTDGALDRKTKELLGLVASMVLRCDDCIRYHLQECYHAGVKTNEVMEVFGIANLVGGTIVIPHTRRAMEFWDALCQE